MMMVRGRQPGHRTPLSRGVPGRFSRPESKLTMSGNREIREEVLRYIRAVHAS
jgi:hypothetical protein